MENLQQTIKDQCEGSFEDYLKYVHYKANPSVLDDDLPDHFDEWISQQEPEDHMRHAENFAQQTAEAVVSAVREMVKTKRDSHCGKKDCGQGQCLNRKVTRETCDDLLTQLQPNHS